METTTLDWRSTLGLVALAGLAAFSGCGGKGAAQTTPKSHAATVAIPALQSVTVEAGVPTQVVYVQALPPTPLLGFEVDLLGTFANVSVSPSTSLRLLAAAALGEEVTLKVRIAPGDQASTVCAAGTLLGTYQIGLDAFLAPVTAAPAVVSASGDSLSIVNAGPWATCLELTSPVAGTFSLAGVEVTVTHDCAPARADLSGSWAGTWSCTSTCGGTTGGSIALEVTQAPDGLASYLDDGGDAYTGAVCGDELRFASNTPLETERGTLRLVPGGAEKRSHWRATSAPYCAGDCVDALHRP